MTRVNGGLGFALNTPGRFGRLLSRLRGRPIEYDLGAYLAGLSRVRLLEPGFKKIPDGEITRRAQALRDAVALGQSLAEAMPETFALAAEAARRKLGMHPYDVQVVGAIAMHRGRLIEMQTGEGKTLVAALAAALEALVGRGLHVLTFNDYLARRDAEWMGPLYRLMGLKVGCVQQGMTASGRREAYAADVTYLTAKEAGFDYLRDGLCYRPDDLVHRPFHAAFVDEADSIMIDEARIPLVIAGHTGNVMVDAGPVAEIVRQLRPDEDFEVDLGSQNAFLTDQGLRRVEAALGISNLHASEYAEELTAVNVALHAAALLRRDVDYIVRKGKVELVDEFTGRVVKDRHWPDGLQAAVEAKEGLGQQTEGRVLGSITLQHFFALYPNLAGMTATARPEEEEFSERYGLKVTVIPPHQPCKRCDLPDRVYSHMEAKLSALTREIVDVHKTGRPILVGTASVEGSEDVAQRLADLGARCAVLNAKQDEQEAAIIAEAGALGAITISTNMAGRGTDIKLGGSKGLDAEQVRALGGLLVLGTNRHESRRIDMQLRGRAGRQGDPGESRFFVSLEDDLVQRHHIDERLPEDSRKRRDEAIEDPLVGQRIAWAQRIIEGQNFYLRRSLWEYSAFVDRQRGLVRERRDMALRGSDNAPRASLEGWVSKRQVLGSRASEVERRVALLCIDRHWADYLAYVSDVREGIQLAYLGGQDPGAAFRKRADAAFGKMFSQIDDSITEQLERLGAGSDELDLEAGVLKGPSATWTYLVDENPFERGLRSLLTGHSIDASIGAAMLGPIYIVGALYNRYFKGSRSSRK